MAPDETMDRLTKELNAALDAMSKSKSIDEKEAYSRIVKNLCDSLGVFLNWMAEMVPFDIDDDFDDMDVPF